VVSGELVFDGEQPFECIRLNLLCPKCLDFNFVRPTSLLSLINQGENQDSGLPSLDYVIPQRVLGTVVDPFPYPKTRAPGSPDPPYGREEGRTILPPLLDLEYGHLKQSCLFAIYNYHYYEYHAAIEGVRRRTILGWSAGNLKAYCQAVPLSTQQIIVRIRKISKESLHLTPAQLVLEQHASSILLPIWERASIGMDIIHKHEAVYHAVINGFGMDLSELVTGAIQEDNFTEHKAISQGWNGMLQATHDLHLSEFSVIRFTRSHGFSTSGWIGTQKLGMLKMLPVLLSNLTTFVEAGTDDRSTARREEQQAIIFTIHELGKAMFCLVFHLFLEKTSNKSTFVLRETIKLLLYRFQALEKVCGVVCEKRKLTTTGNHVALLRIPSIVWRNGSLGSFYNIVDEKSVQKVKRRLDNAKLPSLSTVLLTSFSRFSKQHTVRGIFRTCDWTYPRYLHRVQ
jgi:hypothetical protein